ncbi:MAG: GMC family oxidoreductase, partial [Bacteroidota bacterium]
GRRPTGIYIARFRNVGTDVQKNFIRGFAIAAGGQRSLGNDEADTIGAAYKENITEPGPWSMWMTGMGECLPYFENKITLSKDKKDAW